MIGIRIAKLIFMLLVLLVTLFLNANFTCKDIKKEKALTNDSTKYWDGISNKGLCFSKNGKIVIEYFYLNKNVRATLYADDYIIERINWELKKDTLFFVINGDERKITLEKYLIKKLTRDSLILKDLRNKNSIIKFYNSSDQFTMPIIYSNDNNDTLNNKVKVKIKEQ